MSRLQVTHTVLACKIRVFTNSNFAQAPAIRMLHAKSLLVISIFNTPGDLNRSPGLPYMLSVRLMLPRSCWIFSCNSVIAYINCSGLGGHPGT